MPKITVPPLTSFNLYQAKEVIWDALDMVREECISEDNKGPNDSHWDEICTAMGWLQAWLHEVADHTELLDEQ